MYNYSLLHFSSPGLSRALHLKLRRTVITSDSPINLPELAKIQGLRGMMTLSWLLLAYLACATFAFSLVISQKRAMKGIELRAGWIGDDSSAHDGWNRLKSPTLNKGIISYLLLRYL